MPDAVSVDVLYDFGAKNFNCCAEFIQLGPLPNVHTSLFISHFGIFCGVIRSVMVRRAEKWFMSGRTAAVRVGSGALGRWFVVNHAAFAGMLPSCRLVRRFPERAPKLKK